MSRVVYQIPFSHYCEKVRWALQYKNISFDVVNISPVGRVSLPRGVRKLYPIYEDKDMGKAIGDSTPIMKFLDAEYPHTPRIFPEDAALAEEVESWCIKLDSTLGLASRRLAYAKLIPSAPEALPGLFLGSSNIIAHVPIVRTIVGAMIGGLLIERFQIHKSLDDGVYKWAELTLTEVAEKIGDGKYLVGNRFTAADITLHSLMRPLKHVAFIRENPKLAHLFVLQTELFVEHGLPVTSTVDVLAESIHEPSVWQYIINPFSLMRDLYVKNVLLPIATQKLSNLPKPALNAQYKKSSDKEADNDQHIPGSLNVFVRLYEVFVRLHVNRFIRSKM
eukprot:TRINITY_DN7641_c0_g1_i1.p1 TRINITY_DN7641_c0_g1~~TRINITY_DN7641_c0_g1_i1.p1  ORF type:complete len:334 (+),score=76.00 TRINITY_DN7641_c0_g1_i1:231-1232(+)